MPNQFQRGFEGFGKPIPVRGMTPPAPLRIRQGATMGAAQVQPPAPVQAQEQEMAAPAPQAAPPGRIRVYKKGEPGAPPCPVCG